MERIKRLIKKLGDHLFAEHDSVENAEIISALTGEAVEQPFSSRGRKARTIIYTFLGYPVLALLLMYLVSLVPPPEVVERYVDLPNLIFVMEEGPGGGGGGGGDGSEDPASLQQIEGQDEANVAVKVEVPEDELVFEDPDNPVDEEEDEEEEAEEEEIEEVVAPVVAQAPDELDQVGILEGIEDLLKSAGSGTGGGAGTGTGTGIGEGTGSGLGEGEGGGFGGGAYRMGSGVTPPELRKQVRPIYTEDALARKIEGTVLLEVVILSAGEVGEVRVVRGLDGGLNQQAIDCVRQWMFVPAKIKGEPVDVLVDIEVEFHIL